MRRRGVCARRMQSRQKRLCARGAGLRGKASLLRRSVFEYVCCTFLSECFAFGSCLICGSIAASYVRFTPAIRFYWEVLRSAHACLFSFVRKRETACDMFRSCSAVGRDRHSCVLGCRAVIGLGGFASGLCVSLWRSRRRTKGNAGDGVGGAAECVFA